MTTVKREYNEKNLEWEKHSEKNVECEKHSEKMLSVKNTVKKSGVGKTQ